ncbi:MAG: DUF3179 domain-containing protein [Bacteroidota bacterium]
MNTTHFSLLLSILLGLAISSCKNQDTPLPPPPAGPFVPATGELVMIEDEFEGQALVVVGSQELNFVVSFFNPEGLEFVTVDDRLPIIIQSSDGTEWNVFGEAVSGPQAGSRLEITHSLMGFWLSFGSFYPGTEIYNGPEADPNAAIAQSSDPDWAIPSNRVLDGGPGKDGIPSLENLSFIAPEEVGYLDGDDLVVGFKAGDDARAYPHRILDWHEIVNDLLDDEVYVSINYCPLTGTASAWNRVINNEVTTFGVSGKLYSTNLMPYDRETDSYWSQMRFDCVNGSLIGEEAETYMIVETTWTTWRTMFPDSKILTPQTGFNRDYTRYPYGDYLTNDDFLIFPLEYDDTRLGRKDRVHGVIINGRAKVYPLNLF